MPIVLLSSSSPATNKSFGGLIRELLERTSSGYQSSVTTSAGAVTEVVDAEAIDTYEPTTSYTGGYIRTLGTPLANLTRRVGAYDPNSGTFTFGRGLPTSAPSGMAYQFSELLSFAELKKCINMALSEGYFRDKAYLTPPQVALTTLPDWVVERGQVIGISYGYARSDDPADLDVTPAKWWWADQAGALPGQSEERMIVGVDPIDVGASSLIIEGIRPFPTLLNDDDLTSMDLEWLMAGAKFHFYEALVKRAGKSDVGRYAGLMGKELAKWNTHLFARQPHDPTPLGFRYPYRRIGVTSNYPSWASSW